jgi:hypothetical protein
MNVFLGFLGLGLMWAGYKAFRIQFAPGNLNRYLPPGARLLRFLFAIGIFLLGAVAMYFAGESQEHKKARETTAVPGGDWRDLSIEEMATYSNYMGKGFSAEYTTADIESLRSIWRRYSHRTGKPLPGGYTRGFLKNVHLVYEYDRELEKCVLLSMDSRTPFISGALRTLRSRMEETHAAPMEKLDADFRLLASVASRTPWRTQDGDTIPPLGREQVLGVMQAVELFGRNVTFMDSALTATPLEEAQDPLSIR